MKILIIDNNIDPGCWGSEDLRKCAKLAPDATIVTRRAPQNDLPSSPAGFDRIIVSGSKTSALEEAPWVESLIEFTQSAINSGKPYLGVCFGHQILARSLGGKKAVGKAAAPEFGWSQIKILESSDLMKGLEGSFYSFSAHQEEVCQLPQGMKKLAESELCSIQACQLENKPVFGIQFHPEKGIEEAEKVFIDKRKVKKLELLNSKRSAELYNPKIAEIIFSNFFKL
ncbi:MAG: type 1 glutamine amidotransferase [Bdellovibrionia bacterium]